MFYITLIILLILFVVTMLFSFPQFSPIPYFPSNKKDLPLIIKSLKLRNNQIVFDLGAGDGVVIFEAAKEAYNKKLNTQFVAVEINPVLVLILLIRRFFHPNKKNIKIVRQDIFKINLDLLTHKSFNLLTFYLYVSPWFMKKILKNLKIKKLKAKFKKISFISYFYPLSPFDDNKIKNINDIKIEKFFLSGKNQIFCYQIN